MAAAAQAVLPAGGSVHWETSDFHFDPYNLTVTPVDKGGDDSCGGGKGGGAAGAAPMPVKRRPGRQKRTSVLCQVRAAAGLPCCWPRPGRLAALPRQVWAPLVGRSRRSHRT